MSKSSPEWHESLVAILERRQRLISEVRRGRTLSPDARKLALAAIEAEAFAAAQRVFPRPQGVMTFPQQSTAVPQPITYGVQAASSGR